MAEPASITPRRMLPLGTGPLSAAENAVLNIAMVAALDAVTPADLRALAAPALRAIRSLPDATPLGVIAARLGVCAEAWRGGGELFAADFHLRRACAAFWASRYARAAEREG